MSIKMARPKRATRDQYGETKQRYQIMLTETSSLELDKVAEELGVTRSEVLEWMLRGGGLDIAKQYKTIQESMAS